MKEINKATPYLAGLAFGQELLIKADQYRHLTFSDKALARIRKANLPSMSLVSVPFWIGVDNGLRVSLFLNKPALRYGEYHSRSGCLLNFCYYGFSRGFPLSLKEKDLIYGTVTFTEISKSCRDKCTKVWISHYKQSYGEKVRICSDLRSEFFNSKWMPRSLFENLFGAHPTFRGTKCFKVEFHEIKTKKKTTEVERSSDPFHRRVADGDNYNLAA